MSKRKLDDCEPECESGDLGTPRKGLITPEPQETPQLTCTLPPFCQETPKTFSNYGAYEQHYYQSHSFICHSCRPPRVFPSQRILDLHLREHHDPFFALAQERGDKVYACFVESCEKLCSSVQKRRLHMIDKHGYPKDFLFSVVSTGVRKGQTSLLKQWNKG